MSDNLFLSMGEPKTPILRFGISEIRYQMPEKNLTNETCYISAHFQFESTISGRHIGKMVEDIRKIFFASRSQWSFRKIHQNATIYPSPFTPLAMEGLKSQ
jgi:hypothetical protein